ncbi:MAG: hypothetical protein J4432_02890 [DPANN group archaeon]|nr:hypothetical protein [DPANN group archaeon]
MAVSSAAAERRRRGRVREVIHKKATVLGLSAKEYARLSAMRSRARAGHAGEPRVAKPGMQAVFKGMGGELRKPQPPQGLQQATEMHRKIGLLERIFGQRRKAKPQA